MPTKKKKIKKSQNKTKPERQKEMYVNMFQMKIGMIFGPTCVEFDMEKHEIVICKVDILQLIECFLKVYKL